MKIRINVSKKITGLVAIPIFLICLITGVVSANISRIIITNEIKAKLKAEAYSVSQTMALHTSVLDMSEDIHKLRDYSDVDITLFKDNVRVASTIKGAINTQMDPHIYNKLQSGKDYFTTNANVNNEAYFGYYIPFFEDGKFVGSVFTGISQTEANNMIISTMFKVIFCILGYGVIFVIIALLFIRKMTKKIRRLEDTIGTLLNNDLSVEHNKYGFEHDEIEDISNKTIDFSANLKNIVTKIKEASAELKNVAVDLKVRTGLVDDSCNQISYAMENVANGAVSQAEETSNAAYSITEISNELGSIKANTNDLFNIANSMNNAKSDAMNSFNSLQEVNNALITEIMSTNNQVNETSINVEQIKKAVKMIQDIASQTHLLSLNASIEAAKAGEHGKGFTVVASEIGKLASQSAKYSNEIEEILKELVANYTLITQNITNTTTNMSTQNSELAKTKEVFEGLGKDVNGVCDYITSINFKIEHLNTEISKMVDVVSSLSAISEENSASAEETMASIEELTAAINQVYEKSQIVNDSADALIDEIKVFKTE